VASHADSSEQSLSAPTLSYVAREGRALFLHYCATCHGERGRGDGFNAYNLDPKPRDLSEIEFQAARSDDDLSELIRIGGAAAGLSTTMPPWGGTINERGIHYLVSYLRELRTQPDEAAADEE
jgi:mono/diheme cytochrome c family protein